MTLGERIQRQREKKGWTQRELARQARVDNVWIYRLENGERHNISLEAAVRIAKAFGVSVDYLAGMYADADEEAAPPEPSKTQQKTRKAAVVQAQEPAQVPAPRTKRPRKATPVT